MQGLLYRLWGLLPALGQDLLVRLAAPKMTLGVSAIIVDARGLVLLVRHTYRRPAWGFPSGLVGRHEQPAHALARELGEELELEARIGPLLHADHYTRRHHLTLYYRVTALGVPRHGHETDAHRYVALDELPSVLGGAIPAWLRDALAPSSS